jgi:serine/threonine-protein kinase
MASATAESRMLGHYRLLEKIGSGGMGEVYRAHDEHLDRDVAIKVLPRAGTDRKDFDSKAQRALRQEALTLSRLNHPNIAQVYDFDKEGDTDYIVMEFVPGESLARKLRSGSLAEEELLAIARQTLEGLGAAHAKGIIHRDLKPANLQITPDGRVKILDFGLAQFVHREDFNIDSAPTKTGSEGISGTLAYMSPEQLLGEELDARTDIWSMGVVLFEATTGRLLFRGRTVAETADAILHASIPAISDGSDRPLLRSVIERCLAKDATKRYQTTTEVATDLQLIESRKLSKVAREATGRARGGRTIFVGVVASIIVVSTLLATIYWRQARHSATIPITSVAVLPLANISADPAQEYFSDGMTDAIINELSRASSLKVISRTSVMRYKSTDKPVAQIARELHVDGVIEGSVVREGNRVRINAQLIDGQTEQQLWSDSFERDERNVLALQGEIAHVIMRQLRVRLGEDENWIQSASVDPEAYDALLKARFYTYRITPADNAKAEQFAREAIGRQPDLGEAYHMLSEILWYQAMTLGNPTVEESRSLLQDSLAAAEKALSLGANAHSTHALLLFATTSTDLTTIEKEYQRGIELQPNMSSAHGHYGVFLALIGRCPEARTELLRAVDLDPTGEFAISIAGEFLMYCKDLPSSEHYLLAAMNLDPSYQRAHRMAEMVYLLQHKIPEMLALVDSSERTDTAKAEIHRAFASGGEAGYKQWWLQRVLSDPTQNDRAINMASAYAFTGNRDRALLFLRKAYEQGDPRLKMLRAYPQYWFLWGDSEYNGLLKKLGLPETTK